MKRLLDPSFHRVIIDGIDDPQRALVWDALLKSEHFVDTKVIPSIVFRCIGRYISNLSYHPSPFHHCSFFMIHVLSTSFNTNSMGLRDEVF